MQRTEAGATKERRGAARTALLLLAPFAVAYAVLWAGGAVEVLIDEEDPGERVLGHHRGVVRAPGSPGRPLGRRRRARSPGRGVRGVLGGRRCPCCDRPERTAAHRRRCSLRGAGGDHVRRSVDRGVRAPAPGATRTLVTCCELRAVGDTGGRSEPSVRAARVRRRGFGGEGGRHRPVRQRLALRGTSSNSPDGSSSSSTTVQPQSSASRPRPSSGPEAMSSSPAPRTTNPRGRYR